MSASVSAAGFGAALEGWSVRFRHHHVSALADSTLGDGVERDVVGAVTGADLLTVWRADRKARCGAAAAGSVGASGRWSIGNDRSGWCGCAY